VFVPLEDAFFEPPLCAPLEEDLLPLEEPPREADFEAALEAPLREALELPRLADDPLEAAFLIAFFGAAFFGAAFFAAFFGAALLIAFFGAALLIAFFGAAFLAAFFGALFLDAALFIPFLAALFEPPREELLEAALPLRPELLEDFEPPRLEELLLALFDEDLPPPELLEADFLVAAFFFDFAIFNGF
jgi:hypothetical protein